MNEAEADDGGQTPMELQLELGMLKEFKAQNKQLKEQVVAEELERARIGANFWKARSEAAAVGFCAGLIGSPRISPACALWSVTHPRSVVVCPQQLRAEVAGLKQQLAAKNGWAPPSGDENPPHSPHVQRSVQPPHSPPANVADAGSLVVGSLVAEQTAHASTLERMEEELKGEQVEHLKERLTLMQMLVKERLGSHELKERSSEHDLKLRQVRGSTAASARSRCPPLGHSRVRLLHSLCALFVSLAPVSSPLRAAPVLLFSRSPVLLFSRSPVLLFSRSQLCLKL